MKKIDGYKGIMELDLTDIHPIYHDIIIKQHKRYDKILKTIMSNNITKLFDTGNLLENYNPNYEQ